MNKYAPTRTRDDDVSAPVGVAVMGATGYTGVELVRLLAAHPRAALVAATSRQYAGQRLASAWPGLAGLDVRLEADDVDPAAWAERGVRTVFLALPHGEAGARVTPLLEAGLEVIDLSADFRLKDVALHARYYGGVHPAPWLLDTACYGLSEWCVRDVREARLIANPGCYATAILLGLLPVVREGLASGAPIVVNALSGVSGAGRAPGQATHFVECGGSVAPYRVGESHQHLAEMQEFLATPAPLVFNPHLVPMARGILASCAVPLSRTLDEAAARALYTQAYAGRPFVRVLEADLLPETRDVRGSNRCDIALRVAAGGRLLLVFSAIDNLLKGAAGQAIQNWNLKHGFDEAVGLPITGWPIA